MDDPYESIQELDIDMCYKVIGVDSRASVGDIKKKYRILAKKYHPDTNKSRGAEMKFKALNQAYLMLKQYHESGANLEDELEEDAIEDFMIWDETPKNGFAKKNVKKAFSQAPYDKTHCCGVLLEFNDKHEGEYFKVDIAKCTECEQIYHRKVGGSVMYLVDENRFAFCGNCGDILSVLEKDVYKKVFKFIKTKKVIKKEKVPYCIRCEGKPVFKK